MAKRTGRPTKKAKSGTRASLGLKVTAELKGRLEEAASESGRTQSQEAEYRLQMSFDRDDLLVSALKSAFGIPTAGVALMIGQTMHRVGQVAAAMSDGDPNNWMQASDNWYSDPYAFGQVEAAVHEILRAARPAGNAAVPGKLPQTEDWSHFGKNNAANTIRALADETLSDGLSLRLYAVRDLLGPLLERMAKAEATK